MLREIDKVESRGGGRPDKPHRFTDPVGSYARAQQRIVASVVGVLFIVRAGVGVVYPSAYLKADLVGDAPFLSVKPESEHLREYPAGYLRRAVRRIASGAFVFRKRGNGAFDAFQKRFILLRDLFFKVYCGAAREGAFYAAAVVHVVAELSRAQNGEGIRAVVADGGVFGGAPLLHRMRYAPDGAVGKAFSGDRRAEQRQKDRIVAQSDGRFARYITPDGSAYAAVDRLVARMVADKEVGNARSDVTEHQVAERLSWSFGMNAFFTVYFAVSVSSAVIISVRVVRVVL